MIDAYTKKLIKFMKVKGGGITTFNTGLLDFLF